MAAFGQKRTLDSRSSPQLLERELTAPSWRPQVIGLSGVTDPYQPIERMLIRSTIPANRASQRANPAICDMCTAPNPASAARTSSLGLP